MLHTLLFNRTLKKSKTYNLTCKVATRLSAGKEASKKDWMLELLRPHLDKDAVVYLA